MKIKAKNGTKELMIGSTTVKFDEEGFANVDDNLVKDVKSVYFETVEAAKKEPKEKTPKKAAKKEPKKEETAEEPAKE